MKEKLKSYSLVVKKYNSPFIISNTTLGIVPKDKSVQTMWNETFNIFVGNDFIELDMSYLNESVEGSCCLVEISFVESDTGEYIYRRGPLLDFKKAGLHHCSVHSAEIIKMISYSNSACSNLLIVKDTSGMFYVNDDCMALLNNIDSEHKCLHMKGSTNNHDNFFTIGNNCFNAKDFDNYYEYMESLIGPRPWMVE